MNAIVREFSKETEAAKLLLEQLKDVLGEDDAFLADSIEGQTGLFELMDAAAVQLVTDIGLLNGIDLATQKLTIRSERIKKRIETLRECVRGAMEVAELKKRECPAGTFIRKGQAQKVVITDESAIPSNYWMPQPPKLDKAAVAAALKNKETVLGAELSNGGETIAFRSV